MDSSSGEIDAVVDFAESILEVVASEIADGIVTQRSVCCRMTFMNHVWVRFIQYSVCGYSDFIVC